MPALCGFARSWQYSKRVASWDPAGPASRSRSCAILAPKQRLILSSMLSQNAWEQEEHKRSKTQALEARVAMRRDPGWATMLVASDGLPRARIELANPWGELSGYEKTARKAKKNWSVRQADFRCSQILSSARHFSRPRGIQSSINVVSRRPKSPSEMRICSKARDLPAEVARLAEPPGIAPLAADG